MTEQKNLIEVRDLRVRFRLDKTQTFDAVKGVSFDIPDRSTVALVGESGSGKSVSAMAIMGLLPPESALILEGSHVMYRGRDLLREPRESLQRIRGPRRHSAGGCWRNSAWSLSRAARLGRQGRGTSELR